MVLWRSGTLVKGGHVVQVAAVFMPTVVKRLALEKSRRRWEVGDRRDHQVVVAVRIGLLRRVGEMMMGGR